MSLIFSYIQRAVFKKVYICLLEVYMVFIWYKKAPLQISFFGAKVAPFVLSELKFRFSRLVKIIADGGYRGEFSLKVSIRNSLYEGNGFLTLQWTFWDYLINFRQQINTPITLNYIIIELQKGAKC